MNTQTIIEALDTFTLAELHRIDAALNELIDRISEWQQPAPDTTRRLKGKTYRLEQVKCGKPTCKKCQAGEGHSGYWYAYWWENGKTRKQYIGKVFREV